MATTAQQIIEASEMPMGFTFEAIGFTADGWVITGPTGHELEIGTDTDDAEDFTGYTWQAYDTDGMEGGNILHTGGSPLESVARTILDLFYVLAR